MENVNGVMCISHSELTGRVITTANLKNLVRRGQVRQVTRGCNGREALYEVDSLPMKWRTEVYRRYPDVQEQADSRAFVDSVVPDGHALSFFQDYTLPDGRHLPEVRVLELANGCAIMNAFGRCLDECMSKRGRSGLRRAPVGEFWRKAAGALPYLADRYPHTLPGSPRRLQMKFAEYREHGPVCLVSGKYQNGNAAKVSGREQEAMLCTILCHHNNLPDERVAEYYNHVAQCKGWKEITASAVGVWRKKNDLLAGAARLGLSNFRNRKTMQVKRSRPTAPFLMWSLDGWTVELLYQSSRTDAKGHRVTTFTNRLTMVVVLDPCVNYPIGYAVGKQECPELIKAALRNAAVHSRELFGEMLRANQIQSDLYGIKSLTPLYGVMAAHVTPTRAHNAKGKPVEPYFNYLNTTYCNRLNNWSGYGVTTDPRKQPNSEALNALRHHFPDERGLREQIDTMMAMERKLKEPKLRSMMEALPPDKRLPLSREQYLLNFGAETGFRNVLAGSGLHPTIMGVRRSYDCFDASFREHAAEKWTVRYDPEDLTQVLAVNESGTLRYMLEEKYVQPMALADRHEGDAAELERVNRFNRTLEEDTDRRIAENYIIAEDVIRSCPSLHGSVEERLLITDSRGCHKDNRSRKRLAQAVEVEEAEMPVVQQGNDFGIF